MNHVEYRTRNKNDDIHAVLHEEADIVKKNGTFILPEPPSDPIISWSREDISTLSKSKKYTPEKIDDMVLKCMTWPLRTNSLCHHCCHKFDTTPVPIPETYDELRKIYICKGYFCSWQCAKAYNINYMNTSGCGNRNMNISLLAHRMWVKYIKDDVNTVKTRDKLRTYSMHYINPAQDRIVLKAFGGHMDIEEYRSGFFGIVPPSEAISGLPFLTIKQRLNLPFVDGESKTLSSIVPNTSKSPGLGLGINTNANIRSLRRTQKMDTPRAHQESNTFCDMLNRAKNDNMIMKRTRKDEDTNNLFSCMGVTVVPKKQKK